MGVKISGNYVGGLSMKLVHEPSGTTLLTDPPRDNGGEAKSFSPTDLVATALGSCMMSVMAIGARKEQWDLAGMTCSVEKHMSVDLPRRITGLDVQIELPAKLSPDARARLEAIGNSCPVIQSLHPAIVINKNYHYI